MGVREAELMPRKRRWSPAAALVGEYLRTEESCASLKRQTQTIAVTSLACTAICLVHLQCGPAISCAAIALGSLSHFYLRAKPRYRKQLRNIRTMLDDESKVTKVHLVRGYRPLCGFSDKLPSEWGKGQAWERVTDAQNVPLELRCKECWAALALAQRNIEAAADYQSK